LPAARALPEHGDEAQYVWSAAYFGGRAAHLDFGAGNKDSYTDPGWHPQAAWSASQPMGSRLVYAAALGLTGAPAPALPFSWHDPAFQGPDTRLAPATLQVTRLAAVLCAAGGFALLAARFGWPGTGAAALLLALAPIREDLARAWAEGPLLLGIGLCAVAYGSRWFAPACGAAATFKLTALGLWPLTLWPGATGRLGGSPVRGLLVAAVVWSALTPPSWFLGGPAYLGVMLRTRATETANMSTMYGGPLGVFFPSRYGLPLLVAGALLLAWVASRALARAALRGPRSAV
jgi:hypothetical protein